jgi:glycosyltransferase involved in cell wall biosynthesis
MIEQFRLWARRPENAGRLIGAAARLARRHQNKRGVVRWISRAIQRLYDVEQLVDADWYRRTYPDIALAGVDPALHYLSQGWRERRDPSPHFSTAAYFAANPLVEESGANPLAHYAEFNRHFDWRTADGHANLPLARKKWRRLYPDRPGVLFILHDFGGGSARFAAELAAHISRQAEVVFLRGGADAVEISRTEDGLGSIRYWVPSELDALCAKLRQLDIRRVVVLHAVSLRAYLAPLLRKLRLAFDFVALDYFCLFDEVHLCGPDGRFLGERNLPPANWKEDEARRTLITESERFIACSHDLANRLAALGVPRPIIVAPPPEPGTPHRFRCWPRPIRDGERMRVLTIGAIRENKGREVIVAVARLARARKLPIRLHIYGDLQPVAPDLEDYLVVHTEQAAGPLTSAVCRVWPHLAWFPFQAPETHSYALSDAMAHGLPILASEIGAIPERIAQRANCWLAPWDSSPEQWLERMLELRRLGFSSPGLRALPVEQDDFYRTELLKP